MQAVKKYDLDFQRTFPYFIDHIEGKTLSKKIIQKVDFTKGHFFTFLPLDGDASRIYEFPYGGIMPQVVGYPANETHTIHWEFSHFIHNYSTQDIDNCVIMEDYTQEVTDPAIIVKNVKMIPYQNEVYYFLNNRNSPEDIFNAINTAEDAWHFFGVIATCSEKISELVSLNDEAFELISEQVRCIIAGAYDAEGFIFWERSFNPQKLKLN